MGAVSQSVSAQIVIDMPRAAAWERLADLSLAHHYVPGIVRTEIVSAQPRGVGASRLVYRRSGGPIQETVDQWQEGSGFRLRLHRGDRPAPPFRNASFRYQLEDEGSDRTRLVTTLDYEMPWGIIGSWLAAAMKGVVRRTVKDVAMALKLYYESGRPTTPAALEEYRRTAG